MIKIDKDISKIPTSLKVPSKDFFPSGKIPSPPKTTHKRRVEVIDNKGYIDKDLYNSRYKIDDIRIGLIDIYHNKCAYCEQKVEQYHIEHYRPKKDYYWLAFSWDNLIMACSKCNEHKGVHFDILGSKPRFRKNAKSIKEINNSSPAYDILEKPKMINPEVTNPLGFIEFKKDGSIESKDVRFAYTIEKCKIDRKYLNDSRRKLIADFKANINAELQYSKNPTEQESAIGVLIRQFLKNSNNLENQFLGYRNYAIDKLWLNDLVREAKTA
jgi:uncharacterized protein (TIGR02646 family)